MQNHIFDITSTRDFLQHFLTNWRTKSISPEMVEKLKENSKSDPYAAYGYGRWLSLVNPDGKSIRKAELLLTWAGSNGVQDAMPPLPECSMKAGLKLMKPCRKCTPLC